MGARSIRTVAVVAAILVGVLVATSPAGAARVRSCPKVTVNGGKDFGGRTALLVKVLGNVSCAKARRVTRAWYRRIAAGDCALGGNFCLLSVPGGWSCSIVPAAEEAQTGGAPLGCARGSARIRLYPTKLTLDEFNSADRKVWCLIHSEDVYCIADRRSRTNPAEHGATLGTDGTVDLCHVAHPSLEDSCGVNFATNAPLLRPGQRTDVHGFRCAARAGHITCTRTRGVGKGKGFVIDAADVHAVGGA
jgi:hypothetical protein